MKVLVAGDLCPHGRNFLMIEENRYSEIWNEVPNIVDNHDYCILNFECPIVEHKAKPIEKCGPNLKCTPKAVDAIKYAGFNGVTLANNHLYDYGDTGVQDTINALNESGLDYVGGGLNLQMASKVLYKELDGGTLGIINCCEHEFSIATETTGGANPLNIVNQVRAIMEAKSKADFVLVIVHGGAEHFQLPSPRMKETYQFFIEMGADAVINHHQHCYSGYEIYQGKPIFYGLGNLMFDWEGRRNGIWNEGFMVSIEFLKTGNPSFKIYPYTQCDKTPTIVLHNNAAKANFEKRLQELCDIITDDQKLFSQNEKWMQKGGRFYMSIFQPYRGKIMNSLYMRGILKSLVPNIMKNRIRDYIECESHRDKLLYLIKNEL